MQSPKEKRWFTDEVQTMLDTLYRVAYALLQNDADAQDAVQGSIEHAYASLGALKERKKFRAWLVRILKNECYHILRQKKRVIPLAELPETGAEPFDALDLRAAFSRLPRESRLAVTLYYFEGYSTKEIAMLLDEPLGTVKSRLSRARQAMRSDLAEQEVLDV